MNTHTHTENDSPRDNDARQLFAKLNSDYINSLAKEQVKDRVNELSIVQDEARRLFARKNKDYGDSFATYGPIGVIVVNRIPMPVPTVLCAPLNRIGPNRAGCPVLAAIWNVVAVIVGQ
jgi:hypothetical protein